MLVVNSCHTASLDNRIVFGPELKIEGLYRRGLRLSVRDTVHTTEETRLHLMSLIVWSLNALCP